MKKNILCFGDSNTHGYNAIDNSRFDETKRWPQLLQKYGGDDFLIIEEGLSGRTTVFDDPITEGLNGLTYLTPCMMSHEPLDLLIIMLGTNDTKERFGASPAVIAKGLERLVIKAKQTDAWRNDPKIVIVVPKAIEVEYENTEVVRTMGRRCAQKSQLLADEFGQVAELHNCYYFDANKAVLKYNPIDYMHLDEYGHKSLAKELFKFIKETI